MYLNKRKEKSMKKISVVLIAALVVSLLFGCGKSDDAKGTGKTTLSVWYWGEQEVPGYKAYMEEMVKRYEKKTVGNACTCYYDAWHDCICSRDGCAYGL